MKSYSILALFALAFHSAQADHSKTPSVSNIPSLTNTQSPTSTPVPSGTQDASLIADGAWEQLAHFQSCDNVGYLGAYSTETATYFYNIDQSFDVVQNIYWYQNLAQCEAESGAYLHVALEGTGGPFGLTLLNEDFTLQRMEFTNVSIDVQGWRGVKLMGQDNACPVLPVSTNSSYYDINMDGASPANCPFWASHWSLPHYNAYDSHGDQLMSVSKCTEDILADFDDLEVGTLIKSPDSPSVTATASMSPSTYASMTPSNSPLGPYYTNWMQKLPTLHCTATTPYRTNYDIFFDQHDGTGTSDIFVSGNYTTYPTKLMCQNDLNRLSFSQIQGSGNCYLDSARKENTGDSYTLCTWTPSVFVFRSVRWRATKAWNDMVSGCRHDEDAIATGDTIAFDPRAIPSGTCDLFSDFTNKLYFTTHQNDYEGVNNHVGHRVLLVSDMYTYWIDIDRDFEIDFEPLGRADTYGGDKPFTYLDLADY
jgi:hypothetical protein